MRTYDSIRDAVVAKGYTFYTDDLKLNMIWERTNDTYTNHFTDILHIAYMDGSAKNVFAIPATTKPGIKGSTDSPVTVEGVTGTAVIVPGQYRDAWKFCDTYTEFLKYPYFRQCGNVDYWRDGDRDLEIDRVQFQNDRIFGTHWHRMSNPGTYGSGRIDNWSLGCMGTPEPELKKILPIIRASVAKHGNKFTGTLMETADFGTDPGPIQNTSSVPEVTYKYTEEAGTVIVTANSLNVRNGAPNTHVPKGGRYAKGTVLNYVGFVTNGENVSGNSLWYKEADGDYFWAGAVAKNTNSSPSDAANMISENTTVECIVDSLNIRDQPNLNGQITGALKRGEKVKIIGYVSSGEAVRGNSKWYRSEGGNYIWSGGVKNV